MKAVCQRRMNALYDPFRTVLPSLSFRSWAWAWGELYLIPNA